MAITARSKKVGFIPALDNARRGCGEVWTQATTARQWLYREYDYTLTKGDAQALFCTGSFTSKVQDVISDLPFEVDLPGGLDKNPFCTGIMRKAPSQQRQQTIRRLWDSWETYFSNYENDPNHNPPGPKHWYNPRWLHYHCSYDEESLSLGMGRRQDNITFDWPHPEPKTVDVGYKDGEHVLHCVYDSEWQDLPEGFVRTDAPLGDKVAGIDLGEKVLAAAYDGENTVLVDGEDIRRLRRIQNEEKQEFSERLDRKEKGSARWWKLVRAKQDRLEKLSNRLEDRLHKLSTRLVEELHKNGVAKIAFGDITGIREDIDYGTEMNRRLHQWCFRQFVDKVKYKAERYGMDVDEQTGEAYTSQACPRCDHRSHANKQDRTFKCVSCGFEAHRDQVGALNIRAKFLYPDEWEAETMQAVRATASDLTDFSEARGTPTGGQLRIFGQGRSGAKRATPDVGPLDKVTYEDHMTCVLEDP